MSNEIPLEQRVRLEFVAISDSRWSKFRVTAMLGDTCLYIDTYDIWNAQRRDKFLRKVSECAARHGAEFNCGDCEQRLLNRAREIAATTDDARCTADENRDNPEEVLEVLGLEVLGELDDQSILCWIPNTKKQWTIKKLSQWQRVEMIQALGERAQDLLLPQQNSWVNSGSGSVPRL